MNDSLNIYGIACGMRYLHVCSIIHRDLKPDSIILDQCLHPKITKNFETKLSEFGLCTHLLIMISITLQSTSQAKTISSYSAPEILNSKENTKSSDVYSFGLIVYSFSQFYEEVLKIFRRSC